MDNSERALNSECPNSTVEVRSHRSAPPNGLRQKSVRAPAWTCTILFGFAASVALASQPLPAPVPNEEHAGPVAVKSSAATVQSASKTNRDVRVVQMLESQLTEHGPSAELYSQLGIALYRNHQPDRSLDAFTSMLKFRQPNADEFRFIALDYVDLFDMASADKWLHASLRLRSTDWRTWRYLGGVQFSEELIPQAEASFRECLKLDPTNALAEDGLARTLEAEHKLDKASLHFQRAMQLNKQESTPSSLPYLHYGEFFFRQNNINDALKQFLQAERVDTNNSETHEYLSYVYKRQGQKQKALAEMVQATALRPESPRLHLLLGLLYRDDGNRSMADQEMKRYVDLSRQHKEAWDR